MISQGSGSLPQQLLVEKPNEQSSMPQEASAEAVRGLYAAEKWLHSFSLELRLSERRTLTQNDDWQLCDCEGFSTGARSVGERKTGARRGEHVEWKWSCGWEGEFGEDVAMFPSGHTHPWLTQQQIELSVERVGASWWKPERQVARHTEALARLQEMNLEVMSPDEALEMAEVCRRCLERVRRGEDAFEEEPEPQLAPSMPPPGSLQAQGEAEVAACAASVAAASERCSHFFLP